MRCFNLTLGEKIKGYRKKAVLTQNDLALKCGLSKNAIYNYENNKRVPTIDVLNRISESLNIPLDILLDANSELIDAPLLNVVIKDGLDVKKINSLVSTDSINLIASIFEIKGYEIKKNIETNEVFIFAKNSNKQVAILENDQFNNQCKYLEYWVDLFINGILEEPKLKNNKKD